MRSHCKGVVPHVEPGVRCNVFPFPLMPGLRIMGVESILVMLAPTCCFINAIAFERMVVLEMLIIVSAYCFC